MEEGGTDVETKIKVEWLTSNKLNTHFFHASTIIKRSRNCIERLKDDQGAWVTGRQALGKELVQFYDKRYTSDNPMFPSDL